MIYNQEVKLESEFTFTDQDRVIVAIAGDPLNEVKGMIGEKNLLSRFYFFA